MANEKLETELLNEEKPFDVQIEEKRAPLFQEFSKSRKVSNTLTIVVLIIACAGMYLITNEALWMKLLGWGLLLAGLAGMIVFYFKSKKGFEAHTKEYVRFVGETLTKETFRNEKFKNIETTENKVEVNDLNGNGAYTDIVRVASRSITNGEYSDIKFSFAEIAFFKQGPKKGQSTTAFVGKYINADNNLKLADNIVIEMAGEKPMDLPNGVEGKSVLFNEENITVYGPEGTDLKSAIGQEFFANVKKIPIKDHLLNLCFSISEGRTLVFMSYDDAVVSMPFDKGFDAQAFNSFVDDFDLVFKTISLLGK